MNSDLTEEEMRRALFGTVQPEVQISAPPTPEPAPEVVFTQAGINSFAQEESGEIIYA